MRDFAAFAVFCLLALPAFAAEAPSNPAMDKRICVQARRDTEYNARPIARHDILISNAVGDRRPLRVSTTCIHIYPDALVAVHSAFGCIGMGDEVAVRTLDGRGESCKVVKAVPFIEGSATAPYK